MNIIPKIAVLLSLILISCQSNEGSKNNDSHPHNEDVKKSEETKETEETSESIESDPVPKEFSDVCQAFYDKVCFGQSSPKPILNDDGFYELGIHALKDHFRSLNLFSDAFIQKQDELFSDCTNALLSDSITPETSMEGIEMNAPSDCGFFNYAYYLQSQERPDGFYLRESMIDDTIGSTEIHYFTNTNDSYFSWDNSVVIHLELERVDNSWVITDARKILRQK